ncbi:MAG: D-alanyl-D-alanine carboxypeptidase [Patescibacteria group bacterium]|nr:D-alanyl-D-alanine carboxypeptidase [Patescibacteria group bacterium]
MKKFFAFFLIAAALIFGFLWVNGDPRNDGYVAGITDQEELREKENLIRDNTEKYQPKFTKKTKEEEINISAKSAIVVDQETNEILYAKNIDQKLPPASIIKILTFIIAKEVYQENDLIEISQHASEQISNKINMKAGEKIRTSDLLYGLMMISANDAAYALADFYKDGFDGFVNLANRKVEQLGLKNTKIKNPAGLDDSEQFSTAFDMATITRYALLNHPDIIKYAGKTKEHSVYATDHNEPHWWFGHLSRMLRVYPYMIAAKTGFTYDAGNTYVGIAEKNNRKIIMVMLGSKNTSANEDVKKLLDFGFAN